MNELKSPVVQTVVTLILGMLIAGSCYLVGSVNILGIIFVYGAMAFVAAVMPYALFVSIRERLRHRNEPRWAEGKQRPEV